MAARPKQVRKLIKLEHIFEKLEKETIAELQKTYRDILREEGYFKLVAKTAPEKHIKDEIIYLERTLERFEKMSEKDIKFLREHLETGKILARVMWTIQAISKIREELKNILGDSKLIKKDSQHLKRLVDRLNWLSYKFKKLK